MNLFRRSSTGGEDGHHHSVGSSLSEAATAAAPATNAGGGGAAAGGGGGLKNSFCRVFLPRSRTTSNCNLDRPVTASTASPVGASTASQSGPVGPAGLQQSQHHGKYSASTEWSYLGQKHKRTASLSRNLTRRSRSVTMPNIEGSGTTQPPFSTFHGNGGSTGLSIPPKPPRKTNSKPQQQHLQPPAQKQQHQQPEISKNDLLIGSSSLKTISNSLSTSSSNSYISQYGTISRQPSRPASQLRVSHNRILRLLSKVVHHTMQTICFEHFIYSATAAA